MTAIQPAFARHHQGSRTLLLKTNAPRDSRDCRRNCTRKGLSREIRHGFLGAVQQRHAGRFEESFRKRVPGCHQRSVPFLALPHIYGISTHLLAQTQGCHGFFDRFDIPAVNGDGAEDGFDHGGCQLVAHSDAIVRVHVE